MKAYSKPAGPIIRAKAAFFAQNDSLRDQALSINRAYTEQEPRRACKTCDAPLGQPDFVSFQVAYAVCGTCGPLNGLYEDSDRFTQALYEDDEGAAYKENYLKGFEARVSDIYLPKVDFLQQTLAEHGVNRPPRVLDVGCGGGHFVRACELRDIPARGIDPNASLIDLGRAALTTNGIDPVSLDSFGEVIRTSDATIISMIGVLEHLRTPREALQAFRDSEASVLFISVPLFSLSVFLEHCFPQIFPRHLSGAHTHLYTPESLERIESDFELTRMGEWWFGADMIDLYRSISVSLRRNGASRTMAS